MPIDRNSFFAVSRPCECVIFSGTLRVDSSEADFVESGWFSPCHYKFRSLEKSRRLAMGRLLQQLPGNHACITRTMSTRHVIIRTLEKNRIAKSYSLHRHISNTRKLHQSFSKTEITWKHLLEHCMTSKSVRAPLPPPLPPPLIFKHIFTDEELFWEYSVAQAHRSFACACHTKCVGTCINAPLPDGTSRCRKTKNRDEL